MDPGTSTSDVEVLGPEWQHVRPLGQGAYGSVQLFLHLPTHRQFAVKFIDRGETVTESLRREVINHRTLVHNNICRFKEVKLTSTKLAVVMEYAAGGDLFSYLQNARERRLPENISRYFFQQLISGLAYMHSVGMCHRDMKLENLLLEGNPPMLKLCDFGYSKSSRLQSAAKTKVGTAAYIAPEILMIEKNRNYDGISVDIWSSGVILHTMLMGMYPFCDPRQPNNEAFTMQRIVAYSKGQVAYTPPPHVSKECQEVLHRMLQPDPAARINLQDLHTTPWFQTNLPREFTMENGTRVDGAFEQQAAEEVERLLNEAGQPFEPPPPASTAAGMSADMGQAAVGLMSYDSGLTDPSMSIESIPLGVDGADGDLEEDFAL